MLCHARCLVMGQVDGDHVLRLGDPVGIVETVIQFLHQVPLCPQHLGDDLFLGGNLVFAPMSLVSKAQPLHRIFVEIGDELPLPAVPDARPHGAYIDNGQHREQAQPLQVLHFRYEVGNGLRVG